MDGLDELFKSNIINLINWMRPIDSIELIKGVDQGDTQKVCPGRGIPKRDAGGIALYTGYMKYTCRLIMNQLD